MSTIEWDFSNTLPLPYRVLIVSVIGVWAWGLNLQILSSQFIDVNFLLSSPQEKKYIPAHRPVYTLALILTDIMTSFAKVWGDLYVTGCILLFFDINQEGISRNRCYGDVIAPLFTRFKQCIICYFTSKNTSRNHLFNALKYASAFPVILFSVMQKWYKEEEETTFFINSSTLIFKLWIISVAINSFYSFYWDVAKDWKLEFFNSITTKYYFIPKGGVFLMECLEVVRRWLWLFFRMESEFIENFDKKNYGLINNAKT
ncbi:9530_t:CDS:2, partial [Diversispora eburnea]